MVELKEVRENKDKEIERESCKGCKVSWCDDKCNIYRDYEEKYSKCD